MTYDPLHIQFARPDAYKALHAVIKDWPGIAEANGSLIQGKFPIWFDSIQSAEGQALVQFDYLADRFPGIRFLTAGHKRQPRIAAVSSGINTMIDVAHIEFCDYIDMIECVDSRGAYEGPNSAIFEFMVEAGNKARGPAIARIPNFLASNLSQHHKEKQLQFRGFAVDLLHEAFRLMLWGELKYGFQFNVRPLWAMPSARADSIQLAAQRGDIERPELYYTPGQASVAEGFKVNGLNKIFEHAKESNRDQYWRWLFTTSYASITTYKRHEYHFGPIAIPPFFMHRPGEEIPYFSMPPLPTATINETIHTVSMWYPGQELLLATGLNPAFQRLMAAICMLMTLISSTTRTGSGQHKPVWMSTVLNTEMMRILPKIIACAILDARVVLTSSE